MKTCTNAIGRPGKIGPAASRFPYSRPPLRDSTQVMRDSKSKAKPSEGTPQGPVDRGFAADYFGASPVASALNLPQERDSPENRAQTITLSPPARSKPDISTLQGIGHFYFALTAGRTKTRAPACAQTATRGNFYCSLDAPVRQVRSFLTVKDGGAKAPSSLPPRRARERKRACLLQDC